MPEGNIGDRPTQRDRAPGGALPTHREWRPLHPTVAKWLRMSRAQLDDVYRRSTADNPPHGDTTGTTIVSGTPLTKALAAFARLCAWQGKVFDLFAGPDKGFVLNKGTPFSWTFIVAKVYKGPRWLDGAETIVIDYSSTSFVARKVRDEIREVEPGVYLGLVWLGKQRSIDFALVRN